MEKPILDLIECLSEYRLRRIEAINEILKDPQHVELHEEFVVLLEYMKDASQTDLIVGLAVERLAVLKEDWKIEDELIKMKKELEGGGCFGRFKN